LASLIQQIVMPSERRQNTKLLLPGTFNLTCRTVVANIIGFVVTLQFNLKYNFLFSNYIIIFYFHQYKMFSRKKGGRITYEFVWKEQQNSHTHTPHTVDLLVLVRTQQ
jgi:hypothetical protein